MELRHLTFFVLGPFLEVWLFVLVARRHPMTGLFINKALPLSLYLSTLSLIEYNSSLSTCDRIASIEYSLEQLLIVLQKRDQYPGMASLNRPWLKCCL